MFRVQYLVLFESKVKPCRSVRGFNSLLATSEDISTKNRNISFGRDSFSYRVTMGEVEGKDQRFFDLSIGTTSEAKMERLSDLLREIRGLVITTGGTITPIRDDLSKHWASDLYPRLYTVENTLRLLITKFMLINVGLQWTDQVLPSELQNLSQNKKRTKNESFLHSVDFIHLGDFLFKPYSHEDYLQHFQSIAKVRQKKDIDLKKLRSVLPASNWDRYFKKLIECDGSKLEKQWKELYGYRCSVAHNNFISKADYDSASKLIEELQEIFENAIAKLDTITVPSDERNEVYESVVSSINEALGHFITRWKVFERQISKLRESLELKSRTSIREVLHSLLETERISDRFYEKASELVLFRNKLIHGPLQTVSTAELDIWADRLEEIIQSLRIVNADFTENGA